MYVQTARRNQKKYVNRASAKFMGKMTDSLYVCDKVEYMTLPNFKTFNCSKCNVLVGMTEASYQRYLRIKNIKVICHKCFSEYDKKVKIKTLDKKQMYELKKYIPDLTEEKMEELISKMEMIKNDGIK